MINIPKKCIIASKCVQVKIKCSAINCFNKNIVWKGNHTDRQGRLANKWSYTGILAPKDVPYPTQSCSIFIPENTVHSPHYKHRSIATLRAWFFISTNVYVIGFGLYQPESNTSLIKTKVDCELILYGLVDITITLQELYKYIK